MTWRSFTAVLGMLPVFAIFDGCTGPISDSAKLRAVRAESEALIAAYPLRPGEHWVRLHNNQLPPVIASLGPEFVIVRGQRVEITMKNFLDGGWGYHIVEDKSELMMPEECYLEMSPGVFWHDPC